MALRVEWRTRGEVDDTILVLDEDHSTVLRAVEPDAALLRDYLNDIAELDTGRERPAVTNAQRDPEEWGDLVMARATTGEVLDMNPELFWGGIYRWFRSRGVDPNPVRRRGG